MDVILLQNLGKLGDVGDQVSVKAGYARNYLFPFSKAVPATKDNIADFESRKEELLKAAAEKLAGEEKRAAQINGLTVVIEANAGEEGKLFGSIGTKDIADAITAMGHEVEKSEVELPEGTLRETGEYAITISFDTEVTAEINLQITSSDQTEKVVIEDANEDEAGEAEAS